ncbi:response regulator transcription factor [Halodurantibacterium flavum]|uniref:Response regulator transcription factor n=1 Tax=Halodurantibacterium flavum TaxID=1382802 RepID=A0ABW4SBB3_9RHOB
MKKHVLLVEDEPNIVEALRFILSREGWEVTTHADGATALSTIRQAGPDLVILDVMLPGQSGFDILTALRADARFSDLPVLMLTAKGQSRDRDLAERSGASLFMTKPFSNAEMLDSVRQLLGQGA